MLFGNLVQPIDARIASLESLFQMRAGSHVLVQPYSLDVCGEGSQKRVATKYTVAQTTLFVNIKNRSLVIIILFFFILCWDGTWLEHPVQ